MIAIYIIDEQDKGLNVVFVLIYEHQILLGTYYQSAKFILLGMLCM